MGKPPDLKRITKEDFPGESQELIGQLAFPLNSHMEQVRNLFNKGIDFDNLNRELITLTFQTNNKAQPINKLSFKTKTKIKGLVIISGSITSSNNTYIQTTPFISFSQTDSIVSILNISGLANETKYELLLETIS